MVLLLLREQPLERDVFDGVVLADGYVSRAGSRKLSGGECEHVSPGAMFPDRVPTATDI